MKVLYLDAFSGISGDMTVGALLALGVPFERLEEELRRVDLSGYSVAVRRRSVNGIGATKFDVHVADHGHGHHEHRPFREIRRLIETSRLAAEIQSRALAIFAHLAEAEGRVHGVAADEVEFHEVGAVDSIADIVGTAIGLSVLSIERIHVSPLPLGSGIVRSQHGPLPVPAPATAELLRGFVTRIGDGQGELVTPTGAAIVAALASPAAPPDMRVEAVGYGAGERVLADRPNVLRAVLGEAVAATGTDEQVVIETNIDDCNPEFYDYVFERLFEAGARDVHLAPVHMKKNRPGVVLSVLCADAYRERIGAVLLNETSALGVRYHAVRRMVLERDLREVATPFGAVRVKTARAPDGRDSVAPEYEDCKRIARERGVPLKVVYEAALRAAR